MMRASNALFPIIASHWGPFRACEIKNKIQATPRSSPRKLAKGSNRSTVATIAQRDENIPDTSGRAAENIAFARPVRVPRRQASLGKPPLPAMTEPYGEPDPARKIWTEMRRTSSGRGNPSLRVRKVRRGPLAAVTTESHPVDAVVATKNADADAACSSQGEVERRRQQIKETALRNKRSIGADSLRSLVPSLMNFHLDGGDKDESGGGAPEGGPAVTYPLAEQANGGRWNIGSWW